MCKKNDQELLRVGQATKSMCSPDAGQPPRQVFVIQLEEARKEWQRRTTLHMHLYWTVAVSGLVTATTTVPSFGMLTSNICVGTLLLSITQ